MNHGIKDPNAVLELVRDFIDDNEISSTDDIIYGNFQDAAHEFIESLCKVSGWAEVEKEEEEIINIEYDEDNPFYE